RVAALLPHPLAGGLPHLAMERWPAVQGMLEAASVPGCCAFADFGCDTENLVGIWLRQVGAPKADVAMKPTGSSLLAAVAQFSSELSWESRREAAARLCTNHSAVARFALFGVGAGRGPPQQVLQDGPERELLCHATD
ncbi:unnamed protein product, partial [Polarella glacialis]